ncbi:hypothetical protein Pcinc_025555 [Petrolisthes cinctipes]|uniref:Uncharacterized protein n=1 Tax=Petrolisthes cinctipes TaxID=88211 RepID=A0AAE1KDM3_PETCI|nr:hypothetical protein Pcinc_025555 [Petrolisthes cinctipes]
MNVDGLYGECLSVRMWMKYVVGGELGLVHVEKHVGLLVVEEASTTTWNPDQGSDARQQVKVLAQASSHREPGKVARRQARQERVESAGPGVREVNETRCDRPF